MLKQNKWSIEQGIVPLEVCILVLLPGMWWVTFLKSDISFCLSVCIVGKFPKYLETYALPEYRPQSVIFTTCCDSTKVSTCVYLLIVTTAQVTRPIGRKSSRGFEWTPFLVSKIYTYRLTVYFKCPSVWSWSTSLAAIENHCCPNKSGCNYVSLFMEN